MRKITASVSSFFLAALLLMASLDALRPQVANAAADPTFSSTMAAIEKHMAGRIGVFAVRGQAILGYRADDRFAFCSTFKWILGAAILKMVDGRHLELRRVVPYTKKDLLEYSPITATRVGEGSMSIGDLCAATLKTSDNTAANLLVVQLGGLRELQRFTTSLGDKTTRFDRIEPDLNSNLPGDPRDSTSPRAMTQLLQAAMESSSLMKTSRENLISWMRAATTGTSRIRAGVPKAWVTADKTGTGDHGAINDVAVVYPPTGLPVYLSVFTDGDKTGREAHENAIAMAAKAVVEAMP